MIWRGRFSESTMGEATTSAGEATNTHTHAHKRALMWTSGADRSCQGTMGTRPRAQAALRGRRLTLIEDDLINGDVGRGRPPTNRATQDHTHPTNLSDPQSACVCLFVGERRSYKHASDSGRARVGPFPFHVYCFGPPGRSERGRNGITQ